MEPVEIGGVRYPAGVCLVPNAYLIHHDPAIYPDPYEFRPERFLDEPPGTYTWIPFGGGRRRCLGASFAMLEMKVVLRAVLSRAEVSRGSQRRGRGQLGVARSRSARAGARRSCCARAPAGASRSRAAGSPSRIWMGDNAWPPSSWLGSVGVAVPVSVPVRRPASVVAEQPLKFEDARGRDRRWSGSVSLRLRARVGRSRSARCCPRDRAPRSRAVSGRRAPSRSRLRLRGARCYESGRRDRDACPTRGRRASPSRPSEHDEVVAGAKIGMACATRRRGSRGCTTKASRRCATPERPRT